MVNYKTAAKNYKEQSILTAPRLKIVQMLYDEAIAKLRYAIKTLEEGNQNTFRAAAIKAQAVVSELFASLDYEAGKHIAENLGELYKFCLQSLLEAQRDKTKSSLEGVIRVLATLEEGWDNISDEQEG